MVSSSLALQLPLTSTDETPVRRRKQEEFTKDVAQSKKRMEQWADISQTQRSYNEARLVRPTLRTHQGRGAVVRDKCGQRRFNCR